MKHGIVLIRVLALALALAGATAAQAQDMESLRRDFTEKNALTISGIHDLAAVEEVSTRLPDRRTLRQTALMFIKGDKKRFEVAAPTKQDGMLRFLIIQSGGKMWNITPDGKKVEINPSTHGGLRPDPIITYLTVTLHPQATIARKADFEGKEAIVIQNGPGGEMVWLESGSLNVLKIESTGPMGGTAEWTFRDFKKAGGLLSLPREIIMRIEGIAFYHTIGLLEINAGLDDALFDPDVAAGANGPAK